MSFPTDPAAQIPHLAVNADTGPFVYAVSQMPPGKTYIAEGTLCPWPVFLATWGNVNGVRTKYRELTLEEFVQASPDNEFGAEVGDMFAYSSDPGYDGGDSTILKAADIEKVNMPPLCRHQSLSLNVAIGWNRVSNDHHQRVLPKA